MFNLFLLAQRGANSPAKRFLRENPLILGIIFVALGALLLFFGFKEWKSGVARDKYGNQVTGGMGKLIAGVRIVGGLIAGGFGLYKLVEGLF